MNEMATKVLCLSSFMDRPDGWGRSQGREVYQRLLRFVEDNPSALNANQPPYNETILHDLAGLGHETLPVHARMADELIRAGAEVNCRNVLGWTPIHLIAIHGRKEACELARILITHGADINATANDGISDWRVLWKHGHEIRELLSAASLRRRRT